MKILMRLLCILLVLCFIGTAFIGCGKKKGGDAAGENGEGGADGTTATEKPTNEYGEPSFTSNLPKGDLDFEITDGVIVTRGVAAGTTVTLEFDMETREEKEFFAGNEYTEIWRGGDMIDVLPHGDHIRLYQRDNTKPKYYPLPEDVEFTGASDRGPTQQSPDK